MILFLDFDGVLHPDPCQDPKRMFENAPRLADTLSAFAEISVVLSTSWRTVRPLETLKAALPKSLSARIIGITPNASHFTPPPHLLPYRRQAECLKWLTANHQVDQEWFAIDDRASGFIPSCEQLILCDSHLGFDAEAANRLHAALTLARHRMLRGMDSFL